MRRLILLGVLLVAPPMAAATAERVVVLGFGGADARLTERWMGEGHLPHLVELAERGGYARVEPTVPADATVAWAAAVTGRLPQDNGIFDRVARDPVTLEIAPLPVRWHRRPYLWGRHTPAVLAGSAALLVGLAIGTLLRRFGRRRGWLVGLAAAAAAAVGGFWIGAAWVPASTVVYDGALAAPPFWELAADAGISATVLRAPLAFPVGPSANARVLAGPGTPDARGGAGGATVWTSAPPAAPAAGLAVVPLSAATGVLRTALPAPAGGLLDAPASAGMVLAVESGRVRLRLADAEAVLAPGEWSEWLPVTLRAGPLSRVGGWVRFCLVSVTPDLVLLATPVSLDPRTAPPWVPLASPRGWAAELFEDLGPFATAGQPVDVAPVAAGLVPAERLVEQAVHLVAEQRLLLRRALRSDARLVVQYLELPGVVDAALSARPVDAPPGEGSGAGAGALLDAYRLMDEVVGEVLDAIGPRDVLLVVSEAGGRAAGAAFDPNAWLADQELLAPATERPLGFDWARTRLYGLGRGSLYVNMEGREAAGVVASGRAERELRWEVARRLEGHPAVARVWQREELGRLTPSPLLPDMVLALGPGWALHPASAEGRVATEVVSEGVTGIAAPHPDRVPGVLFATRPVLRHQVHPTDLATTVLELLGLAPPPNGAGVPVLEDA